MQHLLERHPERKVRVLVVWEPIVLTDWRPPSGSTLSRVSDLRTRQFWDAQHLVAGALREIARQKPPQPEPACCIQKGFYWDEAILYPEGVRWKDVPSALFWNGPVVRIIPGLEKTFEGSNP